VIVVDTNVLSEFMRPVPDEHVLRWTDATRRSDLWTTSVVIAELASGVAALPQGRRRSLLSEALDLMLERFEGRVLPFGLKAAIEYGRVVALRTQFGRPIAVADAQIAAVVIGTGATLVTRNTADFDGLGIEVVNPWNA
jgi:predicted nucleic acid-binding protein